MKQNVKHIVVTAVFSLFLLTFAVLCGMRLFNPADYSDVEKRPLAQLPENVTVESILNTKDEQTSTIKLFEKFTVDQFPFREFFRSLKADFQMKILQLKENNGYAVEDGSIAEIETDFTEGLVDYSLGRLQYVYNKYLKGSAANTYFCLIPDKSYFLGKDYGYPVRDYGWLQDKIDAALPEAGKIDIMDTLTLSDYYLTDWHWSQDKLLPVRDALVAGLGASDRFTADYTEKVIEGFRGGYTDMSALYPNPETLVYLTNEILEGCTVYDYETGKTYGDEAGESNGIYSPELLESKEPYNFFLMGTRALLRIDNPNATTDKEIVIFRDSFGSALIPLLAEGYKSIYVVDIRYVMPDMVGSLIGGYEGRDVLFLYSATILNQKAFK